MIEEALEEEALHVFEGGTLSLNPDNKSHTSDKPESPDNELPKTNKPANYWNANFISPLTSIPNKISTTLWSPKLVPHKADNKIQQSICFTENPNNFFTFRESVLARALGECKEQFLDEEADGPLVEAFLLTQISHWNSDKERLLLLATKTLVVVKYDFIALRRLEYKKLPLELVEEVMVGELVYPPGSLIPNRNMRGVRLLWNKDQPEKFATYWNPFNEDIPFCTFTFHPLFFHKDYVDDKLRNLYSMDVFIETICRLILELPRNNERKPCTIHENNIVLHSYVGLGSVIHNRNSLGFFKVRGKFSF